MSFFTNVKSFFADLLGFVKVAAPIADEVGQVTGNPAVSLGAKAAEAVTTVAENSTASANTKPKN